MRVVFVAIAIFLVAIGAEGKRRGPNADNPAVQAILDEMNELMNLHRVAREPKFSWFGYNNEDDSVNDEIDLVDDIVYTHEQAQDMLNDLKRELGYDVPEKRITAKASKMWTLPILYAFNQTQHTEEMKNLIRTGMKLWSDTTCIEFEERPESEMGPNDPYLLMVDNNGCSSNVGKSVTKGPQKVNFGSGCDNIAVVAHELGHALGQYHEHSRPDRDDFVTIYWENVNPQMTSQLRLETDYTDPADTPLDVSSVMMYNPTGMSIDKFKGITIAPHDVTQLGAMGQRYELSFNDIKRINYAYKCIEFLCNKAQLTVECKNGGYQDPKNCAICRCPSGTAGADCSQIEPPKGAGMEKCGGDIVLSPCEIRTLALPTYPKNYEAGSTCTWRIRTAAKGMAFAFQSQPAMACGGRGGMCPDYVEIRSGRKDAPGKFFCKCDENKGRVATIDNPDDVFVRFVSRPDRAPTNGFLLNVYTTCNNTLASKLPTSCRLSSNGYDICGGLPVPLCLVDKTSFIQPAL